MVKSKLNEWCGWLVDYVPDKSILHKTKVAHGLLRISRNSILPGTSGSKIEHDAVIYLVIPLMINFATQSWAAKSR